MTKYFAILSVEFTWSNATPDAHTRTDVFPEGATRQEIFNELLAGIEDELPQVSSAMKVSYFSVQPNRIGGER